MKTKKYGIGYTVFEYSGDMKIPVDRFKPIPGNVDKAMRALERRFKNLSKDKKLYSLTILSFYYGFVVRMLLAV